MTLGILHSQHVTSTHAKSQPHAHGLQGVGGVGSLSEDEQLVHLKANGPASHPLVLRPWHLMLCTLNISFFGYSSSELWLVNIGCFGVDQQHLFDQLNLTAECSD
eukprot:355606-Chlamydomonas_euryale.AAC.1